MSSTLPGSHHDVPAFPTGRIQLQAPPAIEPREGVSGIVMNAIPILGSVGSIVLVAATSAQDRASGRNYLAAGMFLLTTLGFVVVQLERQRKLRAQQVTGARTAYLHYLAGVRQVVRQSAEQQRRASTWGHPEPRALPALADERSRVWERTASDSGFLHVRYGLRDQPLAVELVPPESTTTDPADPAAASAVRRLLMVHRSQRDLPATLNLQALGRLEVCGPQAQARALTRALVCAATAFHSPGHLLVAVLCSKHSLAHWDWLKWLPHALSARRSDAVGSARMVSTSLDDLVAMMPADVGERPRFGADQRPASPHVLLVVDGGRLGHGNHRILSGGLHGVTVLDLPARCAPLDDTSVLRLEIHDPGAGHRAAAERRTYADKVPLQALGVGSAPVSAWGDQCDLATAEAFARRLTPLRAAPTQTGDGAPPAGSGPADVMALLALGDVHRFDPAAAWTPGPALDRLRVPIGLDDSGGVVHLDLKESAQRGMGPHGLVVGATGSGKSEFLRTLVLGLALTHSPALLNLVLVDFKGGATFAGMSGVPHVSAVITNLAQELTLVDRMMDALSGEMVRRQELLREAGNYASVHEYERARASGAPLSPLPSLLIVVDEFSELLSAKPEFIDLFVAVGRLGRSLGLHLLLASQRLDEGRLRGLESHLSYRIGLRTFSAQESRSVLGVPDAYELPPVPGVGYLKPDPTTLLRFQAAYVSGPPAPSRRRAPRAEGDDERGILPFTITEVAGPVRRRPERRERAVVPADAAPTGGARSVLDVAVRQMTGHGPPAHRVWLPPLDVPDSLDALMPDLTDDPALGLVSPHWRGRGSLLVPVGTLDRPREQRRDTLTIDLAGAGGHVTVVGGPRSGKSTLLRTIVTSTSLVTTPFESQFFVLDFGGGTFAPLARLPHVAGVGTRSEPDVVRRIVAEVSGIVDRREAYFRQHGIDSMETYRARGRRGSAGDGYGDVFLVVDGWSTLRADFDDLELELQLLAARGLTFGLHIVSAAGRWADYRAAMRDVFGTRLELRLGDPVDSEVDRTIAALVPQGRPGRGLVTEKLHFLGALPRVDAEPDPASLGAGVEDLVTRSANAWRGPRGPKLRLLPELVTLDDVRAQAERRPDDRLLLLGVDERELAPIGLDMDREPHLLVYGDSQSGKSALLRGLIHEITRTRKPEQAQFVVVDYRRSLLGEVPDDYLLHYLSSAAQADPALRDLGAYLQGRIPGPDVTPEQLRTRSWWRGAEAFVLVDDYDLVATTQSSPLAVLQPLMAQARDVGLHVVVTRRCGGASRASYETVIQTLRDLAMPGLLLSGSPDEGPLLGAVRAQPAPPGRGRLLSRGRGVESLQLAWTDPRV